MGINTTNTNIRSDRYLQNPSYNAVQINMEKPSVNAPAPSFIYDYPKSNGQIYYPPITQKPVSFGQNNIITRSPSGIEDYENYSEVDKNGQEIVSITHSKEGNILIQNIKTQSPDGFSLQKTLKNSPEFKSSDITIRDANGEIILTKKKTHKKLDDDKAQTFVNGEIYNISGLKNNIICVEHRGKTIQLDLNKMLNPDVKILKLKTSPDNFDIRTQKITDEEKEKLFNRIKSLGGDDLIRLSKSVKHLQLLDEKSIESFFVEDGKTLLLSPKDWENSHMVTQHELGHAINHFLINNSLKNELLSDNEIYKNVRNTEKENFKQNTNMTIGEKIFGSKFLYGNTDLAWTDNNSIDNDFEESNLRDETFAECYNNLNNMDIIHYDEELLPMRTLALFKYMPNTLKEADELSKIQ